MGFFSDIVSGISEFFGFKKKPQLGEVYVKPSEVSSVSEGVSYEVPETGEKGVGTNKGGRTQLGEVYVKPSEVSSLSPGTPFSVPTLPEEKSIMPSTSSIGSTTSGDIRAEGSSIIGTGEVGTESSIGTGGGEIKELTPIDKIKNLLFGNYLEKNPLTGEVYINPETGQPNKVYANTVPIGPAAGVNYANVGDLVKNANGLNQVAGNVQEAQGIISGAEQAGEIAKNSKNVLTLLNGFVSSHPWVPALSLGFIISQVTQTITKEATLESKETEFIKEAGASADLFRELGMYDEANKAEEMMRDLRSGIDEWLYYIPFGIGEAFGSERLEKYKRILDDYIRQYDQRKEEEVKQLVLEEREYEEKKLEEKRRYDEQQQAADRAYAESQKQEQRRYDEQQQAEQRAYESGLPQYESEPGSTLGFGLLNSGGATVLVKKTAQNAGQLVTDPEEISMYYFGIPYAQLNDVQRNLVDMIAG
jgi:hypothetical protein